MQTVTLKGRILKASSSLSGHSNRLFVSLKSIRVMAEEPQQQRAAAPDFIGIIGVILV